MSDHDALLAAVLAEPENDLPRLIFADWLEETGHPANAARAMYIRLQIEAERHPAKSARRFECTRQAEELRPTFRDEWDRQFPPGELSLTSVDRRRGFVEEIDTGLTQLRDAGQFMFAVAPVRSLKLFGSSQLGAPPDDWSDLANLKYLHHLERLTIGPGMRDLAPATLLLNCPSLTALRHLALAANGLDDAFVVRFVAGLPRIACAGSLRELDLSGNAFTDAGANTLAAGKGLSRIEQLDLRGNRIGPEGIALLRRRFGRRLRV